MGTRLRSRQRLYLSKNETTVNITWYCFLFIYRIIKTLIRNKIQNWINKTSVEVIKKKLVTKKRRLDWSNKKFLLLQYSHLVTLFIFIQVIGVVFVFLFYYDKSIFISLKIYPDDLFKDAIVRYRDDPDQQDFIDGWQKEVL